MNINRLRYFQEVCTIMNITKAADACHISQPSMTAAINQLESDLGFKLFHRAQKKIFLTDQGIDFLRLTHEILQNFDNYQREIEDIAHCSTSTIKLGLPSILSTLLYPKIYGALPVALPEISLKTYEIPTLTGIELLKDSHLDFLIGVKKFGENVPFNCQELMDTQLALKVNKSHPLADEKLITAEMIRDIPFVCVSKGSFHYHAIEESYGADNLNIILQSTQLSTILWMINEGKAISILYEDIFSDHDEIVTIPLEKQIDSTICIFWGKTSYMSSSIKKFLRFVSTLQL